jgi:hypothetical protein
MKTTKRFLLAAILLAMAFTFSCSVFDDKSSSGNDSSSSQGNQVPSSDSQGNQVPSSDSQGSSSAVPSSSSAVPSSSSTAPSDSTQLYCDFGPPHTYGGGCFMIESSADCNTDDGGAVTTQCGRTDRLYCDYFGPREACPSCEGLYENGVSGGCYMIESPTYCDLQYGSVVTQCSAASVGTALYNSYPRLP